METQNQPQNQTQNASTPVDNNLNAGAHGIGDMARNFANQAQQKAGEQVRSGFDMGRGRAVEALQGVARTLKGDGADEAAPAAEYMNRIADQVQRVADYVEQLDPKRLMSDTEQFARRQPALFLGGAFALGIIAARFLKSSPNAGSHGQSGRESNIDGYRFDRERALANYQEPMGQPYASAMEE